MKYHTKANVYMQLIFLYLNNAHKNIQGQLVELIYPVFLIKIIGKDSIESLFQKQRSLKTRNGCIRQMIK